MKDPTWRIIRSVGVAMLCAASLGTFAPLATAATPVFRVDYPFPTADKPQSKLWFSQGFWWALLPRADGPSLWQRTDSGWKEHVEIHTALRGIPGRADVWADKDGVTAVSVADRTLAVFRLFPNGGAKPGWRPELLARVFAPADDSIETATIARDPAGMWSIAAVVQGKVYAWTSLDGRTWPAPETLAKGLSPDDICTVVPLLDGVGVMWSNQKKDCVSFRRHSQGHPASEWDAVEVVAEGGATADDHLNAKLAVDGSLWVATKNSVDQVGSPQFVLRVRSPGGVWKNRPYGRLENGREISRPIVVLSGTNPDGFLGYSESGSSGRSAIVFGRADLSQAELAINVTPVMIEPGNRLARINDVTSSKDQMPIDAPWIVLASDGAGAVYEADLRPIFFKPD